MCPATRADSTIRPCPIPDLLNLLSSEELAVVLLKFWSRVDKSGECWIWTAGKNPRGYGNFMLRRLCPLLAHRFCYTVTHGPIPDGMWVLHRCDNPSCCNPSHLFLGTPQDNSDDMVAKGRGRGGIHLGERNANAKLTAEQVQEIRQLRAAGATLKSLGAQFGVHLATIGKISSNATWRSPQ